MKALLPGKPLAAAMRRVAGDGLVCDVCKKAGITERALSRYTNGEGEVTLERADKILSRLHLNWWDVWNEDTVREYMLVVRTWQVVTKTYTYRRTGQPRPAATRVRRRSVEYMDLGTDYAMLARIEAWITGATPPKFTEVKYERPLKARTRVKRAATERHAKKKRPGRLATEALSSS